MLSMSARIRLKYEERLLSECDRCDPGENCKDCTVKNQVLDAYQQELRELILSNQVEHDARRHDDGQGIPKNPGQS